MYINWAHFYIPKLSAIFSFFINVTLIKILRNEKKVNLGSYRFLLIFFATSNLLCTVTDCLVPLIIHNHKYGHSVFIADGFFEQKSQLGVIMICIRCSFVPAAYAILHSHFVYRYLTLFSNQIITNYFMPFGLILSALYCLVLMTLWFLAACIFIEADNERLAYMEATISQNYHVRIDRLNIVIALFNEASSKTVFNSWAGVLIGTSISLYAVIFYAVFGFLIIRKLRVAIFQMTISKVTQKLQTQLVKALVAQASLPMLVSFLPCLFAWYLPVFNVDIGQWICHLASIAISFFPVLDPLALFYFVPKFRKRMLEIVKSKGTSTQ